MGSIRKPAKTSDNSRNQSKSSNKKIKRDMALTLYQEANDKSTSTTYYPHSVNKPGLFTCLSSEVANYYDFQYVFTIYDSTGLLLTKYVSPNKDSLGIFNSSVVLKSLVGVGGNYNNEEVTSITSIDYMVEYRVKVQEYYDGALQGSASSYNKSLSANLTYNENDSLLPYEIQNERYQDFLTNQEPDKYFNQSLGTRSSWILPNQCAINTVSYDFDRIEYRIKIWSGTYWKKILYYLIPSTTYSFINSASTINDSINATIKIPVGFLSLAETTVNRLGYTDNTGWVSDVDTDINILDGETYDRIEYLELSLSDNNVTVSESYYWNIDECSNNDITISWKNVYGGLDFMNFNKVRMDKIVNKRKSYLHNSFEQSSNSFFNSTDKTNYSVYSSDKEYFLNVKTDLLQKHEIDLLKGLWYSDEIGMYIDNNYYPILAITNIVEIPSKEKPSFVMYKFDIKYAKK